MSKYKLKYEFLNLSDPLRMFNPNCNGFSVKNTGSTNIQVVAAGSAATLFPGELMKFSANSPDVEIDTLFDIRPVVDGGAINCLIIKEIINAL